MFKNPELNIPAVLKTNKSEQPHTNIHFFLNWNGLFMLLIGFSFVQCKESEDKVELPWKRHTIDVSRQGADGVKYYDINRDGHLDLVSGWEQSNEVRIHLNPGTAKGLSSNPWLSTKIGHVEGPEDALFADIDGDGGIDVISCGYDGVYVHWGPKNPSQVLIPENWRVEQIQVTSNETEWIYCEPIKYLNKNCYLVGSRRTDPIVGLLIPSDNPLELDNWKLQTLYNAGWIMSIISVDMDDDGDQDALVSDRKGEKSGILWLENPGNCPNICTWIEHRIGAEKEEVMFLDVYLCDEGKLKILAAIKPDKIEIYSQPDNSINGWTMERKQVWLNKGIGTAKSVVTADIDGDGDEDLIYSCEDADSPKSGLVWIENVKSLQIDNWPVRDISGIEGIKFDLIQMIDLDGDNDLDVVTTEESEGLGLGVIWYENPFKIDN